MRLAATAAGLLALLLAGRLGAQSDRSLTDSESGILLAQGGATLVPAVEEEDTPVDVQALQERIVLLRSSIKALTESLAIANVEAETFKTFQAFGFATLFYVLTIMAVDGLGQHWLRRRGQKHVQRVPA